MYYNDVNKYIHKVSLGSKSITSRDNGSFSFSVSLHYVIWKWKCCLWFYVCPACYCLFSDYSVLSNFTWNLFEDSGWYRVNFTFTETAVEQFDLQWGRGLLYVNYNLQTSFTQSSNVVGWIMNLCLHACFDAFAIYLWSVVEFPWLLLMNLLCQKIIWHHHLAMYIFWMYVLAEAFRNLIVTAAAQLLLYAYHLG